MKSGSGDITLTLAQQPEAVAIDFRTVSGQLRSDVTNSPDAPAVWKLETVSGNADIFLMQKENAGAPPDHVAGAPAFTRFSEKIGKFFIKQCNCRILEPFAE